MAGQTYTITLGLVDQVTAGLRNVQNGIDGLNQKLNEGTSAFQRTIGMVNRLGAAFQAVNDGIRLAVEAWNLAQARFAEAASFREVEAAALRFRTTLRGAIDELTLAGKLSAEAGAGLQARVDAAGKDVLRLKEIAAEIRALQGLDAPAAAKLPRSAKLMEAELALEKAIEADRFQGLQSSNLLTEGAVRDHFEVIADITKRSFDQRIDQAKKAPDAEEQIRLLTIQREQALIGIRRQHQTTLTAVQESEARKRAEIEKKLDEEGVRDYVEHNELMRDLDKEREAERIASAEREMEIERRILEARARAEKELAERKFQIQQDYLNSYASLLGSGAALAELYGRKGFIAFKALRLAEAAVSTASAVINQLGSGDPYSAWIRAAAAAAAGAVQIATIAATGYAEGGLTPGHATPAIVGEQGPEFVIRAPAVRQFGVPFFESLNQGLLNAQDFSATIMASMVADLPPSPSAAAPGDENGRLVLNVVVLRDEAELDEFLASAKGETRIISTVKRNRVEIGVST